MSKWLNNAVFYEIYPQSFNDTNADGIGDINGIIEKLDYIKELGFNAIWMNPCFKSPFHDAGYDVEDYYTIAPRYGTNQDIKNLFTEAHKRDMHILLDLVPGHTAMACEWFQKSLSPEPNEFSGRYIWTNHSWESCIGYGGISGSVNGFSDRDGCFAANYYSTQPALNYGFAKITKDWQSAVDSEDALSTRAAIKDIILFWLALGCDGFRVDMAFSLVKDDEGHKETIKLWQDVFSEIKTKYPNAAFVAEWGQPDEALAAGYDMDFLLHFGESHYMDLFRTDKPYFSRKGEGDISEFFAFYMNNYTKTNGKGLMCIPSGNHDMPRIAHTLDNEEIKIAYAFLMAMPGAPFIYYGDEIGMKYMEGIPSVEGGYERTGSRTPMQWDNTFNNGFSAAKSELLYIPADVNPGRPLVSEQISEPNSLLNELKKLISIRLNTPELQSMPSIKLIYAEKWKYPLVFLRGDSILIAVNPSSQDTKCHYDGELSEVIYHLNDCAYKENDMLVVPAESASYIKIAATL